jgi:Secretion system C-terminal sorting domain
MKLTLLLLMLLPAYTVLAQLTISPGAQFFINGNIELTLQNTDLVNNGSFAAANNVTTFRGDVSSSIGGSQPIQFNQLSLRKANNSSILLQRNIGIGQRITFTSGFFNLNGFDVDLGTTGILDGEQESTRIIGPNGGEVIFTANLNAPGGANPAVLGVSITSAQNLGTVTIKRGHQSQVNGSGLGNSILRYYNIVAANNANLNATLRFRYLDGELNALNENAITFFQSQNNTNWTDIGFTSRDITANFVEKTGINSFGRFTLSTPGNPLPVLFILFNAKCEDNKVLLTWKTAQEQNSRHFNIERSADGVNWMVIGNLPAAGNSSNERSYSFTDNTPAQNNFYRIAEYDLDGRVQYTSTLKPSCNTTDVFSVWPNPVNSTVFISIITHSESQATIRIFDSKGALVKVQKATVLRGSNQLSADVKSLARY